jgi:DNA-binding CsgD family transcriptional regulator
MSRRGRPKHPDILTPRESEVLDLLREGCSNEQIAERLRISVSGAKYHVSEILSKLHLENRTDAARWRPEERSWRAAGCCWLGGSSRSGWWPGRLSDWWGAAGPETGYTG